MSLQSLSIILIRLLSIYLVASSLLFLPELVSIQYFGPTEFILSPATLMWITAIVLWILAPKISTLLIRNNSKSTTSSQISVSNNLEKLIFLVIGLILIVESLPVLTNLISYNNIVDKNILDASQLEHMRAYTMSGVIEYVVRFAIGVIFVVWASTLGNYFKKLLRTTD